MILTFICLSILLAQYAYASNVAVSNVALQNIDTTANTIEIRFDLSQENTYSGTDANSQAFFDRVWVFVKFWNDSWVADTAWGHATLSSGGTLGDYSSSTGTGIADGVGAFCQPGPNQTLVWEYGTDGLGDTATAKVRVMAIEMVYIPEGQFYAGDASSTDTIMDKDTAGTALISATANIIYSSDTNYDDTQFGGDGAGILVDGDNGIDKDGTVEVDNAGFPTGYNAFYIMKYEVSQGQYRDFLNTLTKAQQTTRVAEIGTASDYAMNDAATVTCRSGIRLPASIPGSGPVTFGCDLDADGTFNEADDGEWLACNYLSWMDLCAFADWAGLRPFTELEFEKASRGGNIASAAGEYAWGNTTIDYFSDLTNAGTSSEVKGPTRSGANCNYNACSPDGPMRCGMFATSSSTRAEAGASYYGVMELSGNLWERPVTIGIGGGVEGVTGGRDFTGTHGDGSLTSGGYADNSDWPGYVTDKVSGATGSGFRGGDWNNGSAYARVADRNRAAYARTNRLNNFGGRCARTE